MDKKNLTEQETEKISGGYIYDTGDEDEEKQWVVIDHKGDVYKVCKGKVHAMEVSKQTRAVFQVGLQLQVASLFHIPPLLISGMVSARTYAAHLESPDAVCAPHPELFGIRHVRRIAESPGTTQVQMCYQL